MENKHNLVTFTLQIIEDSVVNEFGERIDPKEFFSLDSKPISMGICINSKNITPESFKDLNYVPLKGTLTDSEGAQILCDTKKDLDYCKVIESNKIIPLKEIGGSYGTLLENLLRKLAKSHGITVKTKHRNPSILECNNCLSNKGIYTPEIKNLIDKCRKIRNDCEHQDSVSDSDVNFFIESMKDVIIPEINKKIKRQPKITILD